MIRSFRYRLVPTRSQERTLLLWLDLTRELYNAALQERRDAWEKQRINVSLYDQMAQLASVREVRHEFTSTPIKILRGALFRLDEAFSAFFRRCKSGEKPGHPRFRSRGRFTSLLVNDLQKRNPIVAGGKRLAIPLLGKVKLKQHQPLEGVPKALRITRDARGHWYATLACVDVPAKPLPRTERDVGVDLGLHHFAATSDGEVFANPRVLAQARILLERAARRVNRRCRGSKRRREAARLLAVRHERVANLRREHHIRVARSLVERYDTIHVEALNVAGLARSALSKAVNDASWGNFTHWLRCKAEEAGREVVEVDPRGTSQECPACGTVEKKTLAQRMHRCGCGLTLDRDVAAARVILERGRRSRGAAPPVGGRQRSAKLKSVTGPNHLVTGVI